MHHPQSKRSDVLSNTKFCSTYLDGETVHVKKVGWIVYRRD